MMRDAESHADEDRKKKDEVETRNRADQAVYGAERLMADAGDKLSAADKAPVESAIADLKKAIEANDADAIKRGMDALTSAQHKVAEVLYRSAQASPGPEGGPEPPHGGGPSQQGDVIDAEVVDDDKK
jgi:molecular chaperone DnaK